MKTKGTIFCLFIFFYCVLITLIISCSTSQDSNSSSSSSISTNFVYFSVTTNSLGTNGLTTNYFTTSNIPITYFSNFQVISSFSYPFVVTNISNLLINNVSTCQVTNILYFTNYSSDAITNSTSCILVYYFLVSWLTNSLGTNGLSLAYLTVSNSPTTWFSNFIITNSANYPYQVLIISNH